MDMDPLPAGGHVVFAAAKSGQYGSLRSRAIPRAERYALGKSLRSKVPRSALGEWRSPDGRRTLDAGLGRTPLAP